MSLTLQIKQDELVKKQRELALLKYKIGKGEVSGNGAPDLIQQVVTEINQLSIEIQVLTR